MTQRAETQPKAELLPLAREQASQQPGSFAGGCFWGRAGLLPAAGLASRAKAQTRFPLVPYRLLALLCLFVFISPVRAENAAACPQLCGLLRPGCKYKAGSSTNTK